MSVQKWVVGLLVAGSVLTSEAVAQDKAVGFAVRGGGFNGTREEVQKTGWNASAGVNFEFTKHFAIRGDVALARNELRIDDEDTGEELARIFYDASIQYTYGSSDVKPYAFLGAGAVTLHPVGTSDEDQTKFAGTAGLGLSYTIPRTNLGIGVEGKGWLYESDKTQFDATWSGFISYRIPLGAQQVRASR